MRRGAGATPIAPMREPKPEKAAPAPGCRPSTNKGELSDRLLRCLTDRAVSSVHPSIRPSRRITFRIMTTSPLPAPTTPLRSAERPVFERGLDTSSGLGFVQERLALQSKTLFLVSGGFFVFLLACMVLIGTLSDNPN